MKHHYWFDEHPRTSLVETRFEHCDDLIEETSPEHDKLIRLRIKPPELLEIDEMMNCMDYMKHLSHEQRTGDFWRGFGLISYMEQEKHQTRYRERKNSLDSVQRNIVRQIGYMAIHLPESYKERINGTPKL